MFRTLIDPSSGAYDFAAELPHRLLCSRFVVWFGAAGFKWCPCYVVIQQQSRKLMMMDILMFETCWAH